MKLLTHLLYLFMMLSALICGLFSSNNISTIKMLVTFIMLVLIDIANHLSDIKDYLDIE